MNYSNSSLPYACLTNSTAEYDALFCEHLINHMSYNTYAFICFILFLLMLFGIGYVFFIVFFKFDTKGGTEDGKKNN